jgi:hypothetical protein
LSGVLFKEGREIKAFIGASLAADKRIGNRDIVLRAPGTNLNSTSKS